MVTRRTVTAKIVGSMPMQTATFFGSLREQNTMTNMPPSRQSVRRAYLEYVGSNPTRRAKNWIGKYRICKFYQDYKVTTYNKKYFADEIYLVVFSLVKLANMGCMKQLLNVS